MAMIDHWHPVLLERQVGKNPVGIQLCGQSVVLFRTQSGQIGALNNVCPHRRMKLSLGRVCGERLQCTYHGWSFDCNGAGMSPGTPKMYASTSYYDVRLACGAIWLKPHSSTVDFPEFETGGFQALNPLVHKVRAPLELVLDNFCEIEHTPTTHKLFGYPLGSMEQVAVQFIPGPRTVRVTNRGPAKPLSPMHRFLLGITSEYQFEDDWTTYFSPVHTIYDHWWSHPLTRKPSKIRWRLAIVFSPMSDQEMQIFTFTFFQTTQPFLPAWVVRGFQSYLLKFIDTEIKLDVKMLHGLASHDTSLRGMKLSRFDRALGLNRERIDRIYRGLDGQAERNGAATDNGKQSLNSR
jgi:phenylpropionate dioxygenase-like ring-hydroxylating dioxygenase large terminal subunit